MTDPHPVPRSSPGRPRGSPRPQRAHRNPVAANRSARFSDRHLAALATRLTPRDLWLLAMLWEHRVLTTHAIAPWRSARLAHEASFKVEERKLCRLARAAQQCC